MLSRLMNWGKNGMEERDLPKETLGPSLEHGFDLGSKEYAAINRRIQSYLAEDETRNDQAVDDTLRLIMDETGRWSNRTQQNAENARQTTNLEDGFYSPLRSSHPPSIRSSRVLRDAQTSHCNYRSCEDVFEDPSDDLVPYVLKLEANNAFLQDFVDRFEEVSFHKRYQDASAENSRLMKEIERLRGTNSKVYASYCDLVEEVKQLRIERSKSEEQRCAIQRELDILRRELKRTARATATTQLPRSPTKYPRAVRPEPLLSVTRSSKTPYPQNSASDSGPPDDTMHILRHRFPAKPL